MKKILSLVLVLFLLCSIGGYAGFLSKDPNIGNLLGDISTTFFGSGTVYSKEGEQCNETLSCEQGLECVYYGLGNYISLCEKDGLTRENAKQTHDCTALGDTTNWCSTHPTALCEYLGNTRTPICFPQVGQGAICNNLIYPGQIAEKYYLYHSPCVEGTECLLQASGEYRCIASNTPAPIPCGNTVCDPLTQFCSDQTHILIDGTTFASGESTSTHHACISSALLGESCGFFWSIFNQNNNISYMKQCSLGLTCEIDPSYICSSNYGCSPNGHCTESVPGGGTNTPDEGTNTPGGGGGSGVDRDPCDLDSDCSTGYACDYDNEAQRGECVYIGVDQKHCSEIATQLGRAYDTCGAGATCNGGSIDEAIESNCCVGDVGQTITCGAQDINPQGQVCSFTLGPCEDPDGDGVGTQLIDGDCGNRGQTVECHTVTGNQPLPFYTWAGGVLTVLILIGYYVYRNVSTRRIKK